MLWRDRPGQVVAGAGANLPHYRKADRVVATEPDPAMRRRLAGRLDRATVLAVVREDRAESLSDPDDTFDAVLSTAVLCTVPDPDRALAEVARVLKPNGRLVVLEHVRGSGRLAEWQDRLDPVWTRIGAGCHANRDTRAAIERAGVTFELFEEFQPVPAWVPTSPMIEAVATRPS
ncbi:class I SAM-dependent methyltransferase [Pseudonocardia sp. MH-G8]|uniref:class I SAM-dependent methyltransferase n=1 Tax=Pseudonocardia sp. MH-G8 TaxID=1854588 RepID=UPI001E52E8BB|nr:class I SAM-dependent methyltransferase [Pseudonocardia sp. MH-G8]